MVQCHPRHPDSDDVILVKPHCGKVCPKWTLVCGWGLSVSFLSPSRSLCNLSAREALPCCPLSLGILGAFFKYLFSGASWDPISLAHVREPSHLSICARGQGWTPSQPMLAVCLSHWTPFGHPIWTFSLLWLSKLVRKVVRHSLSSIETPPL